MKPRHIDLDGRRYLWSEIVDLRRSQLQAWRALRQPVLFELRTDVRPESERTVAARYLEPSLFDR